MKITSGKLSNFVGQSIKEKPEFKELSQHLVSVDKDIKNLWVVINTIAPYLGVDSANLATNAELGFMYIPVVGTNPAGTPYSYTGHAPIVFCTSNNNLYVYNGTAWKTVNLT